MNKEFDDQHHNCSHDEEWVTNSGNSDAFCHDEINVVGLTTMRLTSDCTECPYHGYKKTKACKVCGYWVHPKTGRCLRVTCKNY